MYEAKEICLQVDFGIVFRDFELTQPYPDVGTFYFDREPYRVRGPERSATLSFEIITRTIHGMTAIRDLLKYAPHLITCLGPGLVCRHCGSKNPSGVLRCVFCGGDVEEKDWIVPASLMGHAYGIEVSRPILPRLSDEDPITEQWEILLDPDLDLLALTRSLAGGGATILPTGSILDDDLYLCQYCGRATPIGETCRGCGGKQIPLSEVVLMDRKCLYCGTKVVGWVMCPNCGKALAAESYKQWVC
jgi:hypothetical protein